jgi:glycosyltransferase involved in cell wall biosynthesis
MRIAIVSDDYLPDSTLVHAKMLHELAVDFNNKGHDVFVITPGKHDQKLRLIKDKIDGVNVWRFRSKETRGVGKVKRAINESLFSYKAWRAIRKEVNNDPFDMCINYAPTIFFGFLVRWFKVKHNSYVYFVLRDLFPQWVIDEGMLSENSIITKYFRFFEKLNYDYSDKIGLMSDANLSYFQKLYPEYKHLEILRNWADVSPIEYSVSSIDIRKENNLEGKVVFFYGGNIGHAQDMSNLIKLAENMRKYKKAHFLFLGQGDQFKFVESEIERLSLTNTTLLPSVSQSQYKEILTQIDVGLFSLAKSHKAHNFPGKLLGYMVQSLPILGSINIGNDLIHFLNEKDAGLAFVNGEDDKLLNAAVNLLNDSNLREMLGCNAHKVLGEYFSVESASKSIIAGASLFYDGE